MKSIETLQRLAKNPFYNLNDEELAALKAAEGRSPKKSSKTSEPTQDKEEVKGAAPVKETGKLNKHPSDPVSE